MLNFSQLFLFFIKNVKKTLEQFIKESKKVHGDKYDYSKVNYINAKTKVCIICPIHGEFWQMPKEHIAHKRGCPFCGGTKKLTKDQFIEKAIQVHGDKYDYSKVEYQNNKIKVCIICPKHGEFWQRPDRHLIGQGCPICKESTLEKCISLFLQENNIEYVPQYKTKWLGKQSLDFYLHEYNIAIECQGKQHFGIGGWISTFNFDTQYDNDIRKRKLCEEHGVKLLYYSDLGIIYPYHVYEDKDELLKEILKK